MGITRSDLHKRKKTGGKKRIHRKKRKFELGRPPAMTKLVSGEKRVHHVRTRGGNRKFRALRLSGGVFSWGSENSARHCRILDVVYNHTNNELVRTKTLVKGCIVAIDGTPLRSWYYKWYGVRLCDPEEVRRERQKAAATASRKKASQRKGDDDEEKKHTKKKSKKLSKTATKDGEEVKKEKKEKKKDDSAVDGAKEGEDKKKKSKKREIHVSKRHLEKIAKRKKQKGFGIEEGLRAQFAIPSCKILAKISSRPGQDGRANGYILEGEELAFYQWRDTPTNVMSTSILDRVSEAFCGICSSTRKDVC